MSVRHEPCPKCGSRDNLARYEDGGAYCFTPGCNYFERSTLETPGMNPPQPVEKLKRLDVIGEAMEIPARGLSQETCAKWNYRYGNFRGSPAHLAYYLDDSNSYLACKVRLQDKRFTWFGDAHRASLYGKWLWTPGKMLVVTEGEIDALTVSQLQQNKWPVVSVPNGAAGAVKTMKAEFDWLNQFETIVLMFDMDEPGQLAARECADLFEPGKVKIAKLPFKDANECLLNGQGEAVIRAMWNAEVYRPDGIVDGRDLWDKIINHKEVPSIPYPWDCFNEKTHGLRTSELVTLTAGSGIGKSAVVRELAYHLIQQGQTIGVIMLEESDLTTARELMSLAMNKRLRVSQEVVPQVQLQEAFNSTVGSGRFFLYDHFGSTEVDHLLSRIRHMAKALDCKWIILDHLSIVVSSMEEGDERKMIDRAMTLLRTLVQETGVGLILVSHLRRPEGRGHEEGAHTSLSQLRGSHSIAQLSDIVIGLERDQQAEDQSDKTTIRILKNRFSGETGPTGALFYDKQTGRLTEVPTTRTEF